MLSEGNRFVFTKDIFVNVATVDVASLERARLEMGSWRQQAAQLHQGLYGAAPPLISVDGDFATIQRCPRASVLYWRGPQAEPIDPSLQHLVDTPAD